MVYTGKSIVIVSPTVAFDGIVAFNIQRDVDVLHQEYQDFCMILSLSNSILDSSATENDGSCTYDVAGCTDNTAYNYDPSANTDDGSCEYVGQVLFYLGYQIPGEIWDTYGESSVYFDLGDENSLNTGIFLGEVGDLSTVTSIGNITAPLCSEASDVILINVLTPEFGSQTYTWRVRNWLSLEVYDYGTFSVSKNDCVKVGVDLMVLVKQ